MISDNQDNLSILLCLKYKSVVFSYNCNIVNHPSSDKFTKICKKFEKIKILGLSKSHRKENKKKNSLFPVCFLIVITEKSYKNH